MNYLTHLCVVFCLFFGNTAAAQEVRNAHIIIALDRSSSTYDAEVIDGQYTTRARMQSDAFKNVLEQRPIECLPVTVSYFSYGGSANQPKEYLLQDLTSRNQLLVDMDTDGSVRKGDTNPDQAMYVVSEQIAAIEADWTYVLFVAEAGGHISVGGTLPSDVTLVKIALFDPKAYDYLLDELVPESGTTHRVTSHSELQLIIRNTLDSLPQIACLHG